MNKKIWMSRIGRGKKLGEKSPNAFQGGGGLEIFRTYFENSVSSPDR